MTNQPIDAMHIPAVVFMFCLIAGVMVVLSVWILSHAGEIIRNFVEAIKQDRGFKP